MFIFPPQLPPLMFLLILTLTRGRLCKFFSSMPNLYRNSKQYNNLLKLKKNLEGISKEPIQYIFSHCVYNSPFLEHDK